MNTAFIYTTVIWLLVIQAFVGVHLYIIDKLKKTPWHAVSFGICFTLSLILTWWYYYWGYMFIVNMVYQGLLYWIIFPIELNSFRGKPLLHLGTASILDKIEASMKSPAATLGLKIVLAIMCSFVLIDLPNPWL